MEEQHVVKAVLVDVAGDGAPNIAAVASNDAEAIRAVVGDAVEIQVCRDASEVHIESASRELIREVVHAIPVDIAGTHGARKLGIIGGTGHGVDGSGWNRAVICKSPGGRVVRGRCHACHHDAH